MALGASLETVATWGLAAIAVFSLLMLVGRQGLAAFAPRRKFRRPRDATQHLRYVLDADFAAVPVMQRMEFRAFQAVEREALSLRRGYRVFSQTALGSVLKTPNSQAFWAINSKRVDALVIAPNGLPVLAVEYQGSGHYQNDAAARDAVKREALRKAGVQYLEVFEHMDDTEIRRLAREALDRVNGRDRTAPAPLPNSPAPGSAARSTQSFTGTS